MLHLCIINKKAITMCKKRKKKKGVNKKEESMYYQKSIETESLICPCCSKNVHWNKTTLKLGKIKSYYFDPKKDYRFYINKGMPYIKPPYRTGVPLRQWMCLSCYQEKKENKTLILANWEKQDVQGFDCFPSEPLFFYEDRALHCKSCRTDFNFSASEQEFWHETANIYIRVAPKMCLTCRKENRKKAAISQDLKALLDSVKKTPNKDDYRRIAQLYLKAENPQKAGIYNQKAKYFKSKK